MGRLFRFPFHPRSGRLSVVHLPALCAKELNIEPLLNKKVTNLSGGEAIRVAIARALIADKDILVVDEPIGCLDEHNSKIVMNLIEKEHLKGKTIIMVSHSKEFEDMTNQIVIIKDKKIYAKENN